MNTTIEAVTPSLEWAEAYSRFWEGLSLDSLDSVNHRMAPEIAFADPFVELTGKDAVQAHFRKVYTRLHGVVVTVKDVAVGRSGAYLRWSFAYSMRPGGSPWVLEGVSEVVFRADGLAIGHVDHWDAASQVYEKLPALGGVLRLIKRRM